MNYYTKITTIEAFQYDGDLKDANGNWYVPDWAVSAFNNGVIYYGNDDPSQLFVIINELSNVHVPVEVGDYIAKTCFGKFIVYSKYVFDSIFCSEDYNTER